MLYEHGGFPYGSVGKEFACNAEDTRDVVQSLGYEDPLEKEMVTHYSILAWKIPWTEGSGGLQYKGCKELDATEHECGQSDYEHIYANICLSPCFQLSLV